VNFSHLFQKKSISKMIADSGTADANQLNLKKDLGLIDLTALAIAAIIGAGIFSTIGNASATGGPAVSLLFVFTAIACAFSALCYADFASRIPLSGSAYTYSYASLGEIFAWIIGWDLIMEYAIGNIAVAISWSDYFTSFLGGIGIHLPQYLTMDYLTASRKYTEAVSWLDTNYVFSEMPLQLQQAYLAWTNAPALGSVKLIADIPAFGIVFLITVLVYIGIRKSKIASNLMVLLKIIVILTVIIVGAFYIKPENWSPFAPNGVSGVLKGVSAVFFAYIGFDAISTTAEECRNPRKDLPNAMILALIITTSLYVLVALVLTGMVNYSELAVGDPLAFVFEKVDLNWLAGIVAFSAIIAMASVLLVFQVGQPRIWMSMSRDGLLPKKFSQIHPKFKTPSFATIVTGIVVAIPALFTNLTEMTDLTSIGTLFAFVMVCSGLLFLQSSKTSQKGKFAVPYINSRYILPALFAAILIGLIYYNSENIQNFLNFSMDTGWDTFQHKIPLLFFIIISVFILILSVTKKLSLIPVLGLLTNLYLMTELGITNWLRFLLWLAVGLVIYFTYGIRKSKLRQAN
jgi:basic amino acid/polyamine antiporter, APA family